MTTKNIVTVELSPVPEPENIERIALRLQGECPADPPFPGWLTAHIILPQLLRDFLGTRLTASPGKRAEVDISIPGLAAFLDFVPEEDREQCADIIKGVMVEYFAAGEIERFICGSLSYVEMNDVSLRHIESILAEWEQQLIAHGAPSMRDLIYRRLGLGWREPG